MKEICYIFAPRNAQNEAVIEAVKLQHPLVEQTQRVTFTRLKDSNDDFSDPLKPILYGTEYIILEADWEFVTPEAMSHVNGAIFYSREQIKTEKPKYFY